MFSELCLHNTTLNIFTVVLGYLITSLLSVPLPAYAILGSEADDPGKYVIMVFGPWLIIVFFRLCYFIFKVVIPTIQLTIEYHKKPTEL